MGSSTCFAYIVKEGEHYCYAYGKRGRTLLVMFICKEGEHYLLCLYGKGGESTTYSISSFKTRRGLY